MGTFTLQTGLGMLAVGMTAILVGVVIIWKVLNIVKENEQKQKEAERERKIYGRDI